MCSNLVCLVPDYVIIINDFPSVVLKGFLKIFEIRDTLQKVALLLVCKASQLLSQPNRLSPMLLYCRYHTGSLAFGAAIIAIVQMIRITLEYIEKKLKGINITTKKV